MPNYGFGEALNSSSGSGYAAPKDAALRNGNTYLPREQLVEQAVKLLKIGIENERERVSENLDDLVLLGQLKSVETDGGKAIMLAKHYNVEKSIASRIVRFIDSKPNLTSDCEKEIEIFESYSN